MMNVLIVDDEPPARNRLCDLLNQLSDYHPCGEASNGAEALRLAENISPDIVLLDIQMPGLDGLETARRLAALPRPPAVIFVTAYGEHALDAFDAHAVAYLLKPVRLERLERALINASRLNRAQLAHLTADPPDAAGRTHIRVRLGQRLELIPLADVCYFQADQKYVTVRHCHGHALIEESLKALENELGTRVVRIHRNALAMATHITGLEKTSDGGANMIFDTIPDQLEVSRRHLPLVRQFLKNA
jgi:two-component system response regulator AlgR